MRKYDHRTCGSTEQIHINRLLSDHWILAVYKKGFHQQFHAAAQSINWSYGWEGKEKGVLPVQEEPLEKHARRQKYTNSKVPRTFKFTRQHKSDSLLGTNISTNEWIEPQMIHRMKYSFQISNNIGGLHFRLKLKQQTIENTEIWHKFGAETPVNSSSRVGTTIVS